MEYSTPIQERLHEMEQKNSSANTYKQGFLKQLKDDVHFWYDGLTHTITEHPRFKDLFDPEAVEASKWIGEAVKRLEQQREQEWKERADYAALFTKYASYNQEN